MKVLVVHNRYSSRIPSGENVAVVNEARWLRDAGAEVHVHEVSNNDFLDADTNTKVRAGIETIWSRSSRRAFTHVLEQFRPDVVHVHNLFPLLSASVPWTAIRHDIPVLWTVHNRRVTCVKGGHFRNDAPCHACRPGWRAPGVFLGCYNNSNASSALLTAATSIFGSIARRRIIGVAISKSMRRWLIDAAGFSPERVHVKYNGVTAPAAPTEIPAAVENRTLLFTGKLVEQKGVSLLLDAWQQNPQLDAELRFVGDGPLAKDIQTAAATDSRIILAGQVDPADLGAHLTQARAVVVPSIWEEPFGLSAAEALAYGRPVITTGFGGLSEIVDDQSGWITGREPTDLAKAIAATSSNRAIAQRSVEASHRYQQHFSPEVTTQVLLDIYEKARSRD